MGERLLKNKGSEKVLGYILCHLANEATYVKIHKYKSKKLRVASLLTANESLTYFQGHTLTPDFKTAQEVLTFVSIRLSEGWKVKEQNVN